MNQTEEIIKRSSKTPQSRLGFWSQFINSAGVQTMVEIGVYRGDFAAKILRECGALEKYYMIDPWQHLGDWNKPANQDNRLFEQFLAEVNAKTDFVAEKRVVLRGRTTEVINKIPDGSLDFAYVDGDHTLRGITIDLIRVYSKVRVGGWIGGDDFSRTIWQHHTCFEPTLVFPFAVYFAEAVGAHIYALPDFQFLIEKVDGQSFAFIDETGLYGNLELREQFHPRRVLKLQLSETFRRITRFANKSK